MVTAPTVTGLTAVEAERLLLEKGPNQITQEEATSPWSLLASQFKSPIVGLLLGACVVAGAMGELTDAVAIGVIVLINAAVGFFQEYRAERAIFALRLMTAPRARVLRDGHAVLVPATEVVPGDLLLLEAGDLIAADAQLVEAHSLTTNEASLTGESLPVNKRNGPVPPDAPLAERHDFVFMGTSVAAGTGLARVTATGMTTELGKIAGLLTTAASGPTPLQRHLLRLSRTLLIACLSIVFAVAVLGLLRGIGYFEVFLSAVSLAVAAVPEGLPAIVTIALAIGVRRIASRDVLVRRLHAVETLGCSTVICTDKTGTLTTGVMAVREVWGSDQPKLLGAAAACCDAELPSGEHAEVGDPTELAILREAAKYNIVREEIEATRARVTVNPFDSERKCMSILRADGVLYVKGAVEVLMPRCIAGTQGAEQANQSMAERGLRVLAVAVGQNSQEEQLTLLGLVGIADPPRKEGRDAILAARNAGIKTVMITGDHPITARAIAREVGLVRDGESVEELVHARATPEEKLRVVRFWKERSEVVAMTGDGVNDAPALREAHIGICMGKTGTEVTREASDMVLTDDNFASIVAAIREGRGIFDNIRKALVYLLAGNAGELLLMLSASLVGLPLPLLPLHLLWINLVTDGFPALALVMDPADADAMNRPARRPDEPLLGRSEWEWIGLTAILQTIATLGMFLWALRTTDLNQARSLTFCLIVFEELLRSFALRSPTRVFWEVGVLGNRMLLAVVVFSVGLQVALHHLPFTQALFKISELSPSDWLRTVVIALGPVTVLELSKLWRRSMKYSKR